MSTSSHQLQEMMKTCWQTTIIITCSWDHYTCHYVIPTYDSNHYVYLEILTVYVMYSSFPTIFTDMSNNNMLICKKGYGVSPTSSHHLLEMMLTCWTSTTIITCSWEYSTCPISERQYINTLTDNRDPFIQVGKFWRKVIQQGFSYIFQTS